MDYYNTIICVCYLALKESGIVVEYKAGYFVISCSPRTSHFVNLNLQTEKDIRIKKKK